MAMTASRKISTCWTESPDSSRCSDLRQTASYSSARGTLSDRVACRCRIARIMAADAPAGLRIAATTASVSITSLTSPTISHYRRCHSPFRYFTPLGRQVPPIVAIWEAWGAPAVHAAWLRKADSCHKPPGIGPRALNLTPTADGAFAPPLRLRQFRAASHFPPVTLRGHMEKDTIGIVVHASGSTGVLHQLTGVIARHQGDIASVEILDNRPAQARTYFEVVLPGGPEDLMDDLRALPIVRGVEIVKTLQAIYGKRIIIMGGGAQVGQVAIGAVSEADRHNIRGEHISVDTIPLVGERKLADAVRAVARLPRAKALVLAGSLMGGDIETAVREVRQQGLVVISLNMAGSVPDAADLVVTDPVQAGVMAVMVVADTAKFTLERLKRRVF